MSGMEHKADDNGGFTFDEIALPSNLMYDKRVYRGSTYARDEFKDYTLEEIRMQKKLNITNEDFQAYKKNSQPVQISTRVKAYRNYISQKKDLFLNPYNIPLPQEERREISLAKHIIAPETTVHTVSLGTETDNFLPKAPEKPYAPIKRGIDNATQIEVQEVGCYTCMELFNFDEEMEALISCMTAKILEQSLVEVEEAQELERYSEERRLWKEKKIQIDSYIQKLEEEEKRRIEERKVAIEGMLVKLEEEKRVREKLSVRAVVRAVDKDLIERAIQGVVSKQYFFESTEEARKEELWGEVQEAGLNLMEKKKVSMKVMETFLEGLKKQRKEQDRLEHMERLKMQQAALKTLRARQEESLVNNKLIQQARAAAITPKDEE